MTTKKINIDHAKFRKKVNGKINERLKKFIKTGHIFKLRPDGKGKLSVPIQQIEQPQFCYGNIDEGVGRGPGKKGDVIDKDYMPGHGPNAGNEPGGAMFVDVDIEEVFDLLYEELRLPRIKPKNTNTFDNVEIKYNNVSKVGPRSLVHKRRTIKQAMRRSIAQGGWGKKVKYPGYSLAMTMFEVIKEDFIYRQWNQIKIPRSNCLVVFARDGSYSMDDFKCNIVSDMSFWLEKWIGRDYDKSETLFLWHDTDAKEVSRDDFYHLRHGGGTTCSSVLKLLQDLIKVKYPPEKWNIYLVYFGDGENQYDDNERFLKLLLDMEGDLNMAAVCQVLANSWERSLKKYIDENVNKFKETDFIRTAAVGGEKDGELIRREHLDEEMKQAIVDILGTRETTS